MVWTTERQSNLTNERHEEVDIRTGTSLKPYYAYRERELANTHDKQIKATLGGKKQR